jgi:hypothetical protein
MVLFSQMEFHNTLNSNIVEARGVEPASALSPTQKEDSLTVLFLQLSPIAYPPFMLVSPSFRSLCMRIYMGAHNGQPGLS